MKNKKQNKTKASTELQYNTYEVLIPSLILLAFILFIGFNLVGLFDRLSNKSIQDENLLDEVWEQSFREAEKSRVGVRFNPITTSGNSYYLMQEAALQFASQEYGSTEVDTQVDVSTKVDEKLYVDGLEPDTTNSQSVDVDSKDMRETGPVYFDNMLMLRYITEDGLMRVIVSILQSDETSKAGKEKDGITSTKQSDLIETLKNVGRTSEIHSGEISKEIIDRLLRNTSDELILEHDYLLGLADSTLDMLKTQSQVSVSQAEQKAIKYYTVEGKQTVYGSRSDIEIKEDSVVELRYIAAGKSDTSKAIKDRIYMQVSISDNDTENMVYIILKLNSNLRVFDIDVL